MAEHYYQDELASTPAVVAGSSASPVATRTIHREGRGLAALVHLGTMVLFGPLFPLGLALTVVAGLDRRPLVRQAAHAPRWFDLTCIALLALAVWLMAADVSVDAGAGLLLVTVATFVVSHLLGAVAALRGREFRYPFPRRLRSRRTG